MHINAKRMRRRVNGRPQTCSEPDYLRITDYRERAAAMGFRISKDTDPETGRPLYTMEGEKTDSYDGAQTFNSLRELQAEIAELWDIATEPYIEVYTDKAGRCYEQLTYPDSPIY